MALCQKIASLVPLTETLEENSAIPKIPISEGPNVIGRNVVPLPDKRLSRKHLTLTASLNGSASLCVEGSNPVVVNTGKERKKINSQERAEIRPGCVIELIPGHHFFKYEVLGRDRTGYAGDSSGNLASAGGKRPAEIEESSRKRPREELQYKHAGRNSQAKREESDVEAIRRFNIPREMVPLTFRLLRVQGLPTWANTSAVSIDDVIQGDIVLAVLSNYMVDIDWLIPACPALAKVPHVLVVHGEGDGTLEHMKRRKPANWILHKPPLPISYGTHHSKAMLLLYPTGVRVIVHTANLIYVDWNNKSQGLWMQDFPWKDQNSPKKGGGFEDDLVDYLTALKLPEFNVKVPSVGEFTTNSSFFRKFDYRDAAVRLIASVPGYHKGPHLKKWGHMKLRSVLQDCTFDKEFEKAPLVYQFSSLGSLDEKWMAELASSMSAGSSEDTKPLGTGDPLIIWPTVEDVRCSLEGYAAGNAVPSPQKNVEKEFLKKYWAKWKATHTGRCRAMPHIKTFARYKGQKLAWFLLTSANLSKAAWGALQKNNSQLMIRSYELGVLFLPNAMLRAGHTFSCTNGFTSSSKDKGIPTEKSEAKRTELGTLMGQNEKTDSSSEIIPLPVPYELPPKPYSSEGCILSYFSAHSFGFILILRGHNVVGPKLFVPAQVLTYFQSEAYDRDMSHGHGIGDTVRKMSMAQFGHGKSNSTHLKILNSSDYKVRIEPPNGEIFTMDIMYFETIREIKGRVEERTGIPVSKQTLLFNGQVLQDDGMAPLLGIEDQSFIQLKVKDSPPALTKLKLWVKTPKSPSPFLMEVDGNDTVKILKEKIYERVRSVPADRLSIEMFNDIELMDDLSVTELGLVDGGWIEVYIKPAPPSQPH